MFEENYDHTQVSQEELFTSEAITGATPLQQCPLYLVTLSFDEKIVQVTLGLN